MSKVNYILLLLAGMLIGCSDDASSDNPAVKEKPESLFISATQVNEIPLETLKSFAQLSGKTEFVDLVKHAIKTYKVVYETDYNGSTIQASGLLYVPKNHTGKAPLISLQHGTTFVKDKAPSASNEFTGMEYFASAGYVALMPDYIGYGESAEIFHPYYDRDHSASCVIDMIKSTRDFLTNEKIEFSDQIFLAGYSEGGYVTLTAAKEIETNPTHNLTVTAVAAGAGGYDLEEMLKQVTTNDYYAYPSYLAFVLMAYNTTYGWNKPLNYFFADKYAEALSVYMDGNYDGWQINSKLTTDVNQLFNPEFFSRLKTTDGEAELKSALTNNSVSGWNTTIPVRLYHGTKDEIIPYQNSEVTLKNLKNAGSQDVSLTLIQGGTHGSSFIPMLEKFVPWFETLRK